MGADANSEHFRTMRGYQLAEEPENGLTSALEDYLEMIGRLCLRSGYTRVGKLSEQLQVKPPSASKMVRKLRELGYVEQDENDSVLLSERGREMAAFLLHRHEVVEHFLSLLGVGAPLEEAEQLEHCLKPDTVRRLEGLLRFFEGDPALRARYLAAQSRAQAGDAAGEK